VLDIIGLTTQNPAPQIVSPLFSTTYDSQWFSEQTFTSQASV